MFNYTKTPKKTLHLVFYFPVQHGTPPSDWRPVQARSCEVQDIEMGQGRLGVAAEAQHQFLPWRYRGSEAVEGDHVGMSGMSLYIIIIIYIYIYLCVWVCRVNSSFTFIHFQS